MLVGLSSLNLSDCVNVTDWGVRGLSERCRKIQHLVLRGCDKLSEKALLYMSDRALCTSSTVSLCDSLKTLSLANTNFPNTSASSSALLEVFRQSSCLEAADLSGLAGLVQDSLLARISKACPTLLSLTLHKCVFLTDLSLCSFAEHLWLERLDISGCHRVTDDGVDVLAEACNGLVELVLCKVNRLTDRSLRVLNRNCRSLARLDVKDCPLITVKCVEDFVVDRKQRIKIIF
jgi:hypothetical protein